MTLAAFGEAVGVASIGHMSDIERGAPCSVAVALRIEALSAGRIAAGKLSKDVALVDAARAGFSMDHAAPDTDTADESSSGKGDGVSAPACGVAA